MVQTSYEQMTAHGLDGVPYTRLARTFADRIAGQPTAPDPLPGHFADGVAAMEVLDAIRRSARERRRVPVPAPPP